MNNNNGYSIYINAMSTYPSTAFAAVETTDSRILEGSDSSKMYNHLVTPNIFQSVFDKIGLQKVVDALIGQNKLISLWRKSLGYVDGQPYPEYALSSMSSAEPYQGLQFYQSGIETLNGECADRIAKSCFSLPDDSVGMNGTMIVPSQLKTFLQAAYCKDFGLTNDENKDQVRKILNEDVNSIFSLPVNRYSNYNHLITEVNTIKDCVTLGGNVNPFIITCSSIQSILKAIHNFLNNVYIFYPRIVTRKKTVAGLLSTNGTYVFLYYRGGKKENRYGAFTYLSFATPLIHQVDNSRSTMTNYINLAKQSADKNSTTNIYNITLEDPTEFPDLIELQANVASDEDNFNMQSPTGSNGSFQVSNKYSYSKVHPLDQLDIDVVYDMFDIRPEKPISFSKVYYAIKFLFDTWISNVSYFQVTSFVCHSNCHLNTFSGARPLASTKISASIAYNFCTDTLDTLTSLGLTIDAITKKIFTLDGFYAITAASSASASKSDDESKTLTISAVIPTKELINAARIAGYVAASDPTIKSIKLQKMNSDGSMTTPDGVTVSAGETGTTTVKINGTDTPFASQQYHVTFSAACALPMNVYVEVDFNPAFTLPQLSLDTNGGKITWNGKSKYKGIIVTKVAYGATVNSLKIPDPTPASSSKPFVGWYNGSNLVDKVATQITENVTWKAEYGIYLTFKAKNNDIKNTSFDSGAIESKLAVKVGTNFSTIKSMILGRPEFTISGVFQTTNVSKVDTSLTVKTADISFTHWSTSNANSGAAIADSTTFTFSSANTIYATFTLAENSASISEYTPPDPPSEEDDGE